MWVLVIVFMAGHSNYVDTSVKYDFQSQKACQQVRADLAKRLSSSYTIITECVEDK